MKQPIIEVAAPPADKQDAVSVHPAMKALVSLTPGGSEFVDDIDACVKFIRERRKNLMKALVDAKRAAPEGGKLREALAQCVEALDSVWAAIGDTLCSGKGIEKTYGNTVAKECRQASDAARAALFQSMPAAPPDGAYKCEDCGKGYSQEWWAESDLWERVNGGFKNLCPECFTAFAFEKGIVLYWPVRISRHSQETAPQISAEEHKIRSCNRHSNCEKAEEEYRQRKGREPGFNFHCHDDECEDCFGA